MRLTALLGVRDQVSHFSESSDPDCLEVVRASGESRAVVLPPGDESLVDYEINVSRQIAGDVWSRREATEGLD